MSGKSERIYDTSNSWMTFIEEGAASNDFSSSGVAELTQIAQLAQLHCFTSIEK